MNFSANVDPADVRALKRAVYKMARDMPGDTSEVLTESARVTVRKAYQATPTARKTTIWRWVDKATLTRERVEAYPTPGARYAKACWIPALKALGARTSERPAKEGDFVDKRRGLRPAFEAINECPYIQDLDAGGTLYPIPSKPAPHPAKPRNIAAKAVVRGTKELDRRMEKFASKQQSFWVR
jgi:hypothetical protein